MVDFPKYESYKDSGVEWLGEIPSHWDIKKLKFMVRIKNGQDYKAFEVQEPGYPVIGSGGRFAYASKYLFEGESVLLGRKGTIDKPLYVNGAFWTVDTMFYSKIYNNTFPKFFYYCASTIPFGYYSTNTAVPSMTQEALGNHTFTYPPIEEQKKIVEVLDRKTAEIDQAIAQKQRLIELLQEQKAILINQAVTKGLDPNVPMCDRRIDWIGEIPTHWDIVRNRYLFKEQNERSLDGLETHLCMSQKLGLVPSDELKEKTLQSESYEGAKLCKKSDLVLNRLKAHLGVFSVAHCDGLVSPDYSVFRLHNQNMIPEYFENLFKTKQYISEFNKRVKGIVVGFYRLYTDAFNDIACLCPPETEQVEIRNWILMLNQEVKIVENAINTEIKKLTELKTVLISNAVTGKIKI